MRMTKKVLLKDLPNVPKGTVFYLREDYKVNSTCGTNYFNSRKLMCKEGDKFYMELPSKEYPYSALQDVLGSPEWFSDEPSSKNVTDFSCPVCGRSTGKLVVVPYYERNYDSDHYGSNCDVYIDYTCGHPIRHLFGLRPPKMGDDNNE